LIQKVTRGFLARLQFRRRQQTQFRAMRKLRRLLSVAYGRKRTLLKAQLLNILKLCHKHILEEQE
jgi:hypothetical protein